MTLQPYLLTEADHDAIYKAAGKIDFPPSHNEIADVAYNLGYQRRKEEARAALAAPEGCVLVPVELIEAFKHQRQCDEGPVEIVVSRQAVCELLELIAASTGDGT